MGQELGDWVLPVAELAAILQASGALRKPPVSRRPRQDKLSKQQHPASSSLLCHLVKGSIIIKLALGGSGGELPKPLSVDMFVFVLRSRKSNNVELSGNGVNHIIALAHNVAAERVGILGCSACDWAQHDGAIDAVFCQNAPKETQLR